MSQKFKQFRKEIGELDRIPKGYGVAYYQDSDKPVVCYPKAISWVIRHFAEERTFIFKRVPAEHKARGCTICK